MHELQRLPRYLCLAGGSCRYSAVTSAARVGVLSFNTFHFFGRTSMEPLMGCNVDTRNRSYPIREHILVEGEAEAAVPSPPHETAQALGISPVQARHGQRALGSNNFMRRPAQALRSPRHDLENKNLKSKVLQRSYFCLHKHNKLPRPPSHAINQPRSNPRHHGHSTPLTNESTKPPNGKLLLAGRNPPTARMQR